ncbi:MAG: hypothetical protein HN849_34540 [Victivallales bacterium]|nr:hypothetical protein [Victivallales bacterium]
MSILSSTLRAVLALGSLVSLMAIGQPAQGEVKPTKRAKQGLDSLLGIGTQSPEKKGQLKIDADCVEMDFNNRKATFEGNVKVSDERMLLLADKMIVHLTEKNELSMIEALGNVVISEVGKMRKAKAGKAVFNVAKDEIVLTDKPTLETPQFGVKEAEKMIYNRKKATFKLFKVHGETRRIDKGARSPTDLLKGKEKEEPKP